METGGVHQLNTAAQAPGYRREIDGLRALAVVPVMLFHAGFDAFKGGYVGVDVFFVVSGYLITTIILADVRAGAFSITEFYERRARRILPALFLVLAASTALAFVFLLPRDLKEFSASLISVSLFASNFFFWSESGYFANAVELKPLIHTWSLAVEEQFYLFYPLLILLIWRFARRRLFLPVLAGTIASLCLAQWAAFHKPEANFYLLPTRAFELGIGALAAMYLAKERRARRFAGEFLAVVGIGGIFYAIIRFDNLTPFPSIYALLPTLGTVLLILFATPRTMIGKALAAPPLVAIGLISYSAYLWHQPLYAFARHRSFAEPRAEVFLGLALLSLALAFFSWRFVERPFRNRAFLSRRQVFAAAGAASLFFIAIGAVGVWTNGYFFREALAEKLGPGEATPGKNHGIGPECDVWFADAPPCATAADPEILVWGDSYAMHLMQGILASRPDAKIAQATTVMCGPLLGIAPLDRDFRRPWAKACVDHNDRVLDWLSRTPSVTHVVLAVEYSQYSSPEGKYVRRHGKAIVGGADASPYLVETAQRIRALGKVPVFVTPTPQDHRNLGRCVMKAKFLGENPTICDFARSDWRQRMPHVDALIERMKAGSVVIDLADAICDAQTCRPASDGVSIYLDQGHLSAEGSVLVGRRLDLYRRIVEATPQK